MGENRELWIDVGGGRVASIGKPRRKRGVMQPPGFIVLGPLEHPEKLRKTICSGRVVDGRAEVQSGVIDDAIREKVEKLYRVVFASAVQP